MLAPALSSPRCAAKRETLLWGYETQRLIYYYTAVWSVIDWIDEYACRGYKVVEMLNIIPVAMQQQFVQVKWVLVMQIMIADGECCEAFCTLTAVVRWSQFRKCWSQTGLLLLFSGTCSSGWSSWAIRPCPMCPLWPFWLYGMAFTPATSCASSWSSSSSLWRDRYATDAA